MTKVLGELEDALSILERRGLNLPMFLAKANEGGALPSYRVHVGGHEHWFQSAAEVDAFHQAEQRRLGHDLVVADELHGHGRTNGQGNGHADTLFVQDLHEVRAVNRGLERLREFGLGAADLVPARGWPAASRRRATSWRAASSTRCWARFASW